MQPVVAIVVAAGSGVRLGGGTPKALRLLGGHPLVWHSLRALADGGVKGAAAVSYTHLDVYKRQQQGGDGHQDGR